MASIHGTRRENGDTISTMKGISHPLSTKALPLTPLLAEIPPTPDGVVHNVGMGLLSPKDLLPVAHTTKVTPLPHPDTRLDAASGRRSSSSNRVQLNRRSLVPGRDSSENTAVSIFSMYTEETGPIREAAEEDLSNSQTTPPSASGTQVAPPKDLSRERPQNSKRPRESRDSTEMSISADTMAALLYADAPINRVSITTQAHGITRVSLPDSIRLPYDDGFPTTSPAAEPSDANVTRSPSGRSVNRPTTATSIAGSRLSSSRDRPTSSGRTSVVMSSCPSSELRPSGDNLSTPALLLPLPPSRNNSRASRPTSAQPSELSPPSLRSKPLPPAIFPTLSSDSSPKQKPSTSALTTLSQPRSHRGADEEADAEYVRSVYARFDVTGGVPGDGYEEGVERTRARLSSNVQLNEPTAQSKSDIDENEQRRLGALDRYGFFLGAVSTRQESRLTLLPGVPLGKKVQGLKPSAPAVPVSQKATPPEIRSAPSEKPPTNEIGRLRKWQAMMRPTKRDPGGNTETWSPTGNGTSPATFRRRVWKGVPDRWRPATWQMLIDDACKRNHSHVMQAELERQYRVGSIHLQHKEM